MAEGSMNTRRPLILMLSSASAMAAMSLFACLPAQAQTAMEPRTTVRIVPADLIPEQPIGQAGAADQSLPDIANEEADPIGAIIILGNAALPDATYQSALEDYFGKAGSEEMLAQLINEITQIAKDEGYSYANASLAPGGAMRGVWQIVVDEGRVDEVRVEGYENAQALAILRRLEGGFAHRPTLEKALLQIGDIPAVRLLSAKFHQEDGRGVLVVGLERKSASYRLSGDNYGTASFGPVRTQLSTGHTDVLTASDRLSASVRINPVDLDELLFFSASYSAQVTAGGPTVELAGSVGKTAPGGAFQGSDLTGNSTRASISVTQPLITTRRVRLWLDTELAYLSVEQEALDTMLRSDTVVTAAVGLRGQIAFDGGRLRGGLRYVRGLDLFDATRRGDPLASRSDGDAVFSRIEGWVDARVEIAPRLGAYLLARGQLADRPLLASQEMALGGAYSVRGYNFSEVLGDEGFHGLAELQYQVPSKGIPLDALQFYAFVDGGYVTDIENNFGEGSLFSAGPGVRARLGPVDLEIESAFPLGGSAAPSNASDPEINLRAGLNF